MNSKQKEITYGSKAGDQIRDLDPQIKSQVGKAVKRLKKAAEV